MFSRARNLVSERRGDYVIYILEISPEKLLVNATLASFFFSMGNVTLTQTKLDLGVVCGCGATPKVKRQLKAHTRKSDFALSLQVYLSNK
jgi:hypothetical protein